MNKLLGSIRKLFALRDDQGNKRPLLYVVIPSFVLIFGFYFILNAVSFGYYESVIITVIIYIVLAASLNIATGFLGQLILGHAAFLGIGAYAAGFFAKTMQTYIPNETILFILSSIVAFIVASIIALIIGTPALRLRGDYLGILTLGFGEIMRVAATNFAFTGGASGLKEIPKIVNFTSAYFMMVVVILIIILMMNSKFGRAMLSIREDEIATESVGINLFRYKILGFVLAAGFGAVGGAILAFKQGFFAPSSMQFMQSVNIFVIVVLGGIGSITGSIISATVLQILPQVLLSFESYRMLVYSSILIIVMLFRPQGLLGTKEFSFDMVFKGFDRINPFKKDKREDGVNDDA